MSHNYYLEYGHFIGKTGNHIDARLNKELLFNDQKRLSGAVKSLTELVPIYSPEVIVSEEAHGALLARMVGETLGLPVLIYTKSGLGEVVGTIDLEQGYQAVIVEDNIITGSSVYRMVDHIKGLNVQVVGVVSVFSSMAANLELGIEHSTLIKLPVNSVDPSQCTKCQRVGSYA